MSLYSAAETQNTKIVDRETEVAGAGGAADRQWMFGKGRIETMRTARIYLYVMYFVLAAAVIVWCIYTRKWRPQTGVLVAFAAVAAPYAVPAFQWFLYKASTFGYVLVMGRATGTTRDRYSYDVRDIP
jgi:hypothetical protein